MNGISPDFSIMKWYILLPRNAKPSWGNELSAQKITLKSKVCRHYTIMFFSVEHFNFYQKFFPVKAGVQQIANIFDAHRESFSF